MLIADACCSRTEARQQLLRHSLPPRQESGALRLCSDHPKMAFDCLSYRRGLTITRTVYALKLTRTLLLLANK